MNIFYLSHNPVVAAQMHCDKHVVKMVIEYAQLLSTAHRLLDGFMYQELKPNGRMVKRWFVKDKELESVLYKATHGNHPSAIWVRQSAENYKWTYDLFTALCDEYTYRYGKVHATDKKLRKVLKKIPENIPHKEFTTPPQCMDNHCKMEDTIEAYRNFYNVEKKNFATWKVREKPNWFGELNANLYS